MKQALQISALALASAFTLVACDGASNKNPIANAREAAEDKDLQGKTFRGECDVRVIDGILSAIVTGGKFNVSSARQQYQFVGANVTHTTLFYEAPNCEGDEAVVFRETGSIDINPKKRGEDQSKFINMKMDKLTMVASNEAGVKIANEAKLCGREDWAAGQDHEVTGDAAKLNCYRKDLPVQEFNVYRLDSGDLFLGDPSTKEESRPQQADMSVKYSSQD